MCSEGRKSRAFVQENTFALRSLYSLDLSWKEREDPSRELGEMFNASDRFVAVYLYVGSGCCAKNSNLVSERERLSTFEKMCVVINAPLEGTPQAKIALFARLNL